MIRGIMRKEIRYKTSEGISPKKSNTSNPIIIRNVTNTSITGVKMRIPREFLIQCSAHMDGNNSIGLSCRIYIPAILIVAEINGPKTTPKSIRKKTER